METNSFPGANSEKLTEEQYLDYTLQVFQPRSPRPLTREDARAIGDMAVNFFHALEQLQKSNSSENAPKQTKKTPK